MISQAVLHKGFSIIDIFQPCVTFNSLNTYQWFRERIYKLEGHDVSNKMKALEKAMETEKLPVGIFYREEKETFEETIHAIAEKALVRQDISVDKEKLLEEFL